MSSIYLYGRKPLIEVAKNHPECIERVFLTPASENEASIMSTIQKHKFPYERVTAQEIEHAVGKDAIHQGVCALLHAEKLYTPLATVLEEAKMSPARPLFVLLDELKDPHNVGAIIRSCAAFGATAVLLPEHDEVQVTGTVIKSSAGAVFSIPIVRIGNVNDTLRKLKEVGFWVYGLDGGGEAKLETVEFDADTVLVIGSEGEGIRQKTLELCDFRLSISITGKAESLNASNAAAIALYEWKKQQDIKK